MASQKVDQKVAATMSNIYQKLLAVQKKVEYIQKEKKGGLMYKYASSSDVLGHIRPWMDEQGLILETRVLKQSVETLETSKEQNGARQTKKTFLTTLEMEYTWINAENPSEKIACKWCAQGIDDQEKGLGKALTYAKKEFLRQYFTIACDEMDPDQFADKVESYKEQSRDDAPVVQKQPAPVSSSNNGNGKTPQAPMQSAAPVTPSTPNNNGAPAVNGNGKYPQAPMQSAAPVDVAEAKLRSEKFAELYKYMREHQITNEMARSVAKVLDIKKPSTEMTISELESVLDAIKKTQALSDGASQPSIPPPVQEQQLTQQPIEAEKKN